MIERVVLVCGILALLAVPEEAQAYTSEQLSDMLWSVPDVNVTQVNETTYMVLGATQESEADDLLNRLGERPDVNVTRVNGTACLFILQPTEKTIALRDKNNRYVREYNENLYVDSTGINTPEKFRLIDRGNNKVSFLAPNGKYVGFSIYTSEGGWVESPYPTALFDETDSSTVFEKTYKGDGGYVFKTYNGGYLKVEDDGRFTPAIVADFSGSYDIFQMEIQDEPIQKSIDTIRPGGTIYLKEGVYKQTVTIDKPVSIYGADSGETFIDGDHRGPVFTIGKTNSDVDVEVYTITIRGGSSENGGGINNFGRLTLFDVAITRCTASNSGGGVFNHGRANCVTLGISNCSAELGAGVFNDVGSDLALNSVLIQHNIARSRGGGVYNKGSMRFGGGTVHWNEPDEIVDDTTQQPAGDLGSPAVSSEVERCGPNRWLCARDSCKSLSECSNCARDTWLAWSEPNKDCMGWQHVCCRGSGDCNSKDKHGCYVCRCHR
jgi:hypothetical protein